MVGEPITATATVSNVNPKHTLAYNWSEYRRQDRSGKDKTANIDTNGVAGGSYTVTARIYRFQSEKRRRRQLLGDLHRERAAEESADHVMLGQSDHGASGRQREFTCTCTSPDNVPVTVSGWTATGGSVSGSGNSGDLEHDRRSPGRSRSAPLVPIRAV